MPEFAPTPSQRAAIETSGRSVLVSAGAGSGKTKVLTERLMRYVLDRQHPENIDRFVIITFTRAAAGELRGRITEELIRAAAEAAKDPDVSPSYLRHIRRQQSLVGRAQIGTIHHFCSSVLRENSHLTSLPPDFKILGEERGDAMKENALEKALERRYASPAGYPGFEELVNSVGIGRDDSVLVEQVLSLYEKMQCHAFPEKWAEKILAEPDRNVEDISRTVWGKEILRSAKAKAEYLSRCMDRLITLAAGDENARKKYLDSLSESAAGIRELVRCIDLGWEAARHCAPVAFPRPKPKPAVEDEELNTALKEGRDACKEALKKIYAYFRDDTPSLIAELRTLRPSVGALFSLVQDFSDEFAKEKLRAGYADYSDLEHMTARLLINDDGTPSALARHLSESYTEIMVDEYQDVSRVQDAIFFAVSRGGNNLFLVGDVKQSIYRFRLSDAEIFNEKYRKWPLLTGTADSRGGGDPVKILLRENFRSRREILDCANSVFRHCMSEELGDVNYDGSAALVFGSAAYGDTAVPVPELSLIRASGDSKNIEAQTVAAKIVSLMASGATVMGKSGPRPLEYGDIAVLLRSANAVGAVFRRALTDRGIPVVTTQGGGFFQTREIALVLSLLKVLDNPRRDAELIAVMSSPLFGFTPDDLAEIRAADRDTDLWGAVNAILRAPDSPYSSASSGSAPGVSPVLREKLGAFVSSLSFYRSVAPDMTCDRLIRLLLSETGLPTLFSAMPDGEQKEANLTRLIKLAADFEKDGARGFHRFVRYLIRLSEKNTEIPASADRLSAVQILSIHRSKGLEYPVVFLCGTGRPVNKKDSSETVLVHPVLGLGPKIVDSERMIRYPSTPRRAITMRIQRESLSEELRLLYVAMTRPKERLFITAVTKDPAKLLDEWRKKVPPGCGKIEPELLAESQNYLGWLLAAYAADQGQHMSVQIIDPEQQTETSAAAPMGADMENKVPAEDGTESETENESEVRIEAENKNKPGIENGAERKAGAENAEQNNIENIQIDALLARLKYIYPYEEAASLPSKVTATELKHAETVKDEESYPLVDTSRLSDCESSGADGTPDMTDPDENSNENTVNSLHQSGTEASTAGSSAQTAADPANEANNVNAGKTFRFPSGRSFRRPDFTTAAKPLTATERGIATHLTLQHMDIRKGTSRQGVLDETERLRELGFLSAEQAKAVNTGAIVRLFTSPLGQRILNAPVLHREFRFSLLVDAMELFGKAPGEQILLQGVVDCCIEEEDGLTVIDYKTDSVRTPEQLQERKEFYSSQVKAYATALNRIFQKPVKETVLYFLAAGKAL